jgi:outer membrane autotransporter protein
MRGFGSGSRIDNGVSREFDQVVGGMQIGADRRLRAFSGDLFLGLFAGYVYAARDFLDGGDGSTNGLTIGGYATWIHPQGWYADLVVKYSELWNYFSTPTADGSLSNGHYKIPAFGGSHEFGRRFDFDKLYEVGLGFELVCTCRWVRALSLNPTS